MNSKMVVGAALVMCAFGLSGCASLKNMVPKKKKTTAEVGAELKAAEDAKNLKGLQEACKTGMFNEAKLSYTNKKVACGATGRLLGAEMANVDCKELKTFFENAKKTSYDLKNKLYQPYGMRAAECDQWTVVFEDLMHWGQVSKRSMGYKLLAEIDKAGKPLEAKFVEYLKSTDKPLNIKHSNYAMAHYTMWRETKSSGEACSTYASVADKLNGGAQYYLLNYFMNKKCKEGMPLALKGLGSDGSGTRILSCRFLGKMGDATHVKKLRILADRDGYSYVSKKNYRTVYPVRTACGDAIAKIQVRQ